MVNYRDFVIWSKGRKKEHPQVPGWDKLDRNERCSLDSRVYLCYSWLEMTEPITGKLGVNVK